MSRPEASSIPCSIDGNTTSPLNSTRQSGRSTASRTASWTATTRLGPRCDHPVELGLRVSMRRSSEIVSSANRSPTLSIPALCPRSPRTTALRLAIADSITARCVGRVEASPPGAAKRGSGRRPAPPRLRLDQVGRTLVSEPGIENSSFRLRRRPPRRPRGDGPDPAEDDAPRMRGARPPSSSRALPSRAARAPQASPCRISVSRTLLVRAHSSPPVFRFRV